VTDEQITDTLVPIAAQLIGTVRDYGPADVAAVLARVPDGRFDALAVVLAAMVDPDVRPSELLAWTTAGPVQSREEWYSHPLPREHGSERGYKQHLRAGESACEDCLRGHREANKVYRARTAARRKVAS
jgi:hypothetical protein